MLFETVAPYAGAWIEIRLFVHNIPLHSLSLPTRERGLKYSTRSKQSICSKSLPTRERGLKWLNNLLHELGVQVAPYAGAWIEIDREQLIRTAYRSRSLRGSVD